MCAAAALWQQGVPTPWSAAHTGTRSSQGRHNMMVDAWRRVLARARISSSLEPHKKQLPRRLRATGLPALPSRATDSHPRDSEAACATSTTFDFPTTGRATPGQERDGTSCRGVDGGGGGVPVSSRESGGLVGGRGNQDGPPVKRIRSSVGTGSPMTTAHDHRLNGRACSVWCDLLCTVLCRHLLLRL